MGPNVATEFDPVMTGMIDFVAGAVEETTEFSEHDESLSTKSVRSIIQTEPIYFNVCTNRFIKIKGMVND